MLIQFHGLDITIFKLFIHWMLGPTFSKKIFGVGNGQKITVSTYFHRPHQEYGITECNNDCRVEDSLSPGDGRQPRLPCSHLKKPSDTSRQLKPFSLLIFRKNLTKMTKTA